MLPPPDQSPQPLVPVDPRTDVPHSARMYDWFLGGKTHFAADREAAGAVAALFPQIGTAARANRDFVTRAVRHCVGRGVHQVLDIGTGIPGPGAVHATAQQVEPSARVVYVDNDPLVLAHARALLRGTSDGRVDYLNGDLREPGGILAGVRAGGILDLSCPVVLVLAAVLHLVDDADDPRGLVEGLREALAPGSFVILSHVTGDFAPEAWERIAEVCHRAGIVGRVRTEAEVRELLGGWELLAPGVVPTSRWRPSPEDVEPAAADASAYAGVARIPLS